MHDEVLLPKNIVDPYCLYREDTASNDNLNKLMNTKSPTISGLSLHLYENFRKSFNDTYSDFYIFLDSFSDILDLRIKREEFSQSKNPRLTLINLCGVAQALFQMQQEYNKLFLSYAAKDYLTFEQNEKEAMLTFLNLWHHILNNLPRGYAVSYDAKQYYRKTSNLVRDGFKKGVSKMGRAIIVDKSADADSKTVYLLKDYDPFQLIPIENIIKNACLKLREQWKDAIGFQSMRWYLETQWPKMVFVPLYKGVPMSVGFKMPLCEILAVDEEEQLVTPLFPTEIPVEIYHKLDINFSKIELWFKAVSHISKLRLLLIQYNDVIKHISGESDTQEQGLVIYLQALLNDIIDTITNVLEFMKPGISILSITGDAGVAELFDFVIATLRKTEVIDDIIQSRQPFEELPEQLKNVALAWHF